MCDYVAGELLLGFYRRDPAGVDLLERISAGEIPHVSVIETIDDRLERLKLSLRRDRTFTFVRLAVPPGEEAFNIAYLRRRAGSTCAPGEKYRGRV